MPITIRKAEPKDANTLGQLQVTSWRSAFRNIASDKYLDAMISTEKQAEDWKQITADHQQVVLIIEENESAIGYVWARPEDDPVVDWDAELMSIHVLPEHKHQGLGRKLFAAAASQLKEQGCQSVYLWVLVENLPARKFYETLGGQYVGKHQIELGDRELTEVAYGWKDIKQLEIIE